MLTLIANTCPLWLVTLFWCAFVPNVFPVGLSKLHHMRVGPFKILKRLGVNAYQLSLPGTLIISPVFNVEDLIAYLGDPAEHAPTTDAPSPTALLPTAAPPRDKNDAIWTIKLFLHAGEEPPLIGWQLD
jgi:hypothetical protein